MHLYPKLARPVTMTADLSRVRAFETLIIVTVWWDLILN